jgi:hypothetical protein
MLAAAVEFDDCPGPMRDAVVGHFQRLNVELRRAVNLAVEEGHFARRLDVEQFLFDLMGILHAYHYQARLLNDVRARARAQASFARLVAAASP